MRLAPTYALPYNTRGIAWERKGDFDRAIADFTEAMRLDPKFNVPYNNLGNLYLVEKGDLDRAIACFNEAIGCLSEIQPCLCQSW